MWILSLIKNLTSNIHGLLTSIGAAREGKNKIGGVYFFHPALTRIKLTLEQRTWLFLGEAARSVGWTGERILRTWILEEIRWLLAPRQTVVVSFRTLCLSARRCSVNGPAAVARSVHVLLQQEALPSHGPAASQGGGQWSFLPVWRITNTSKLILATVWLKGPFST